MGHARFVFVFALTAASAYAQARQDTGADGGALYARHCARCHDLGLPRTPTRRVLSGLAPEQIVASLDSGTMRTQGAEIA